MSVDEIEDSGEYVHFNFSTLDTVILIALVLGFLGSIARNTPIYFEWSIGLIVFILIGKGLLRVFKILGEEDKV